VRICVQLADWAGIFQVDELLHRKLEHSTLAPYVEVVVITQEGEEKRLH
jgi:metal-dependent HD superfamily phosphatase/phosphodiesterase